MTVALAALVRDEAENIGRCLDAALPIVDRVLLVDTGSVDATREIARAWADESGVPLVLLEEPWQNFAHNRTHLLRQARAEADWLLLLDADMVVHADPLPELDAADCWHGRIRQGSLDYTLPFLIRASKPWRYEGVAHSYLACDEPYSEAELPSFWIEDHSHTSVAKLGRDLEALSAEHARNPLDARTVFYLAQTYYDLDRLPEAIHFYRLRASMDGWDEETYFARYRLGCLLCENVSFAEGARELLAAWEQRPGRIEALRALAGSATSVANKAIQPPDQLFVGKPSYRPHEISAGEPQSAPIPEYAPLRPRRTRKPRITKRRGLDPRDVTAIIVTRGNVSLDPVIEALPYPEVIVWNNAEREHDYRCFGRYAAIPEATRPVVFWVDDDVIVRNHDALLREYQPGVLVCNMDKPWFDAYQGQTRLVGAGSLCDADLPARTWAVYLDRHPFDEDVLLFGDHAFGILTPSKVVDVGYDVREFTDDADRLYRQPDSTERKWAMVRRAHALHDQLQAA